VPAERARSRRAQLLALGTAVVLVVAGASLALVVSRGSGGHPVAGPGVGVLPTAPLSAPTPSTASSTSRPAPASGSWPRGVSAWTVVVATMSKHGHPRAAAERIARAASLPGLPARVLDSSLHPRLRPALWIVFVGRFSTRAQALRMARRVKATGAPSAVVERLTG
jgi:SPOR domain